jgi:hypothetical protein
LVIKTSLYYDAGSEKHQMMYYIFLHGDYFGKVSHSALRFTGAEGNVWARRQKKAG